MIRIAVTYNLKSYRRKRNMTIRKLERISGVSKSQISAIENGKTHPTVFTICLLSAALKVKPCRLYSVHYIGQR